MKSLCSVFYINSTCCQLSYAATGVLPMDTHLSFSAIRKSSEQKVLRTESPQNRKSEEFIYKILKLSTLIVIEIELICIFCVMIKLFNGLFRYC